MSDTIKTFLSIVLISVVLVLLLKNANNTSTVIKSLSDAVGKNVSVLQGNAYATK